jgi:phosphoglycolate phosphatase
MSKPNLKLCEESNMLRVERIEISDLPQLAGLYDQLVKEKTNRDRMKEIFINMDRSDDYYLLGAKTENDLLVGSIMGIVCLDLLKQGRPFMVMENLIVDSKWQGNGVGKLLLAEIESIARKRNCIFIQFCSSSYRKAAHKFYEACGYDPNEVQGFRKFLQA